MGQVNNKNNSSKDIKHGLGHVTSVSDDDHHYAHKTILAAASQSLKTKQDLVFRVKLQLKYNLFPFQFRKPQALFSPSIDSPSLRFILGPKKKLGLKQF